MSFYLNRLSLITLSLVSVRQLIIRLVQTFNFTNNMQSMIVDTISMGKQLASISAIVKVKTWGYFHFGNCGLIQMHRFVVSLSMAALVEKC